MAYPAFLLLPLFFAALNTTAHAALGGFALGASSALGASATPCCPITAAARTAALRTAAAAEPVGATPTANKRKAGGDADKDAKKRKARTEDQRGEGEETGSQGSSSASFFSSSSELEEKNEELELDEDHYLLEDDFFFLEEDVVLIPDGRPGSSSSSGASSISDRRLAESNRLDQTYEEEQEQGATPFLAKQHSPPRRTEDDRELEEDMEGLIVPDERPSSPPGSAEAATESPPELHDKDEWDRVRRTAVGRMLLSCWRTVYRENHPDQNPDEACGAPWLGLDDDASTSTSEEGGAAPSEEATNGSDVSSAQQDPRSSAKERSCPARVDAFSVFSEPLVRDILNTLRLSGEPLRGEKSHWEREFGGESLEEKFLRQHKENVFSRISQLQPHEWFMTIVTHLARNDMLEGFFRSKILEGHPEQAAGEWKTERRPENPNNPQDHFIMNASFHYSLVLDTLARLMDDYPGADVLADVFHHFERLREKLGLYDSYTDGAFEKVKFLTVNPAMKGRTPHIEHWATAFQGNEYRTQELNWTLRANIWEASVQDMANKNNDNADAGVHMVVSSETSWPAAESFQRLYESWNMCFVTGNFKEAPLFWSKLYAPMVTGAKPEEYMFHRMNVLFVHWHTIMLLRYDFVNHPRLKLLPPPYRNRADVSTRPLTIAETVETADVILWIQTKSANVSFLEAYAKMQISPWNKNDGMLRAWGKRNLEFARANNNSEQMNEGLVSWKLSLAPLYAVNGRWAKIQTELQKWMNRTWRSSSVFEWMREPFSRMMRDSSPDE